MRRCPSCITASHAWMIILPIKSRAGQQSSCTGLLNEQLPLSLRLWWLSNFSVSLMKRVRHTSVNFGPAVVLMTGHGCSQGRHEQMVLSLMCYMFKILVHFITDSGASGWLERWLQKHVHEWIPLTSWFIINQGSISPSVLSGCPWTKHYIINTRLLFPTKINLVSDSSLFVNVIKDKLLHLLRKMYCVQTHFTIGNWYLWFSQ